MQMDVVRKALASVLEVELTPSPSARHTEALRTVKKMLDTAGAEVLVEFRQQLVSAVSQCFTNSKRSFSLSRVREEAQTAFFSLRLGRLQEIWACFYFSLGLTFDDPLLSQAVNRRVFDYMMIEFTKSNNKETGVSEMLLPRLMIRRPS